MISFKPYSTRCSLEVNAAPSKIFQSRVCVARSARKTTVKPNAAYMPNFGPISSDSEFPLHGVLHSTKLPSVLADRIDIYDARDAIEACGGLWGEEKEECYAIFGVDPNADIWYDVVFKLETSLEMETSPEEDALHHGRERC